MQDELRSLTYIATVLSSKWTLPVVYALKHRTRRYSDLKRHLPHATQRMLTLTLRKLEKDGLLKRKIYPTIPPRVEYTLTPLGLAVFELTQTVSEWAERTDIISDAMNKIHKR